MADEQVSILITAVDDVSKKLDNIKKNIASMTTDSSKQTESLGEAFNKAQGNLLVLGQAAQRVDSIFDSYANMQLRVENAQTRVYEASKNVRDAQYALSKATQDSTTSAEDLAKAQDDLESANNRLMMSQNNLEKTNNAITGTYIQMGMSIVTVLASIPTLATAISGLITLFTGLQIAAGPIGWILLGIGAAIAGVTIATNAHRKAEEDAQATNLRYEASLKAVELSYERLHDEVSKTNQAMKIAEERMSAITGGKSREELENLAKIAILKEKIANPTTTTTTTTELNRRGEEISITSTRTEDVSAYETELAQLEELQKNFALRRDVLNTQSALTIYDEHVKLNDKIAKDNERINALYKADLSTIPEFVKTTFNDLQMEAYKEVNDKLIKENKRVTDEHIKNWGAVERAKNRALGTDVGFTPYIPGTTTRTDMGSSIKFNDFIQRPGQSPTVFSPDDTIIGVKDTSSLGGKNIIINITGNIYGVNAADIAQSLDDNLRGLIRG